MAVKTDAQLKAQFASIRDETTEGGNTKERVYNALNDSFDTLLNRASSPPLPTGVSWVVTPSIQLNGNTIQVSPGSIRVDGVVKNVAQRTITETARPAGFQTPFTAVLNPYATPPVIELLEADTVAENESYSFESTPANRLFIGNFMLTSAGFQPAPGGQVKGARINNQDIAYPDPAGILNIILSEKFTGIWKEGTYQEDAYFITPLGFWRAKKKHGSAVMPTVDDANVELVQAFPDVTGKLDIAVPTTTGSTISFLTDRVYGSPSSPVSGNIIFNLVGAKVGVHCIVYYQNGTPPLIATKALGDNSGVAQRIEGSEIVNGVVNILEFRYCVDGKVEWWSVRRG